MRSVIVTLLLWLPMVAVADIYKCKDSSQKLVYQDTPCATRPVGKLAPLPPLSPADEQRAREGLARMQEENRYYEQKRRDEARLKAEELRLQEEKELRERELATAGVQREASSVYIPVYGPGYPYGNRPRHPIPPVVTPVRPEPRRPCVIGYVGDRSCR